jgi:hypothetical protein
VLAQLGAEAGPDVGGRMQTVGHPPAPGVITRLSSIATSCKMRWHGGRLHNRPVEIVSHNATDYPGEGHDLHGCPARHEASEEPGTGQIQYTLQARKDVATRWRARSDILIEIRWYSAHKGVPGNEKADELAKLAAKEPDARGVEWVEYPNRMEARAMPLPRSFPPLKLGISEKKWAVTR